MRPSSSIDGTGRKRLKVPHPSEHPRRQQDSSNPNEPGFDRGSRRGFLTVANGARCCINIFIVVTCNLCHFDRLVYHEFCPSRQLQDKPTSFFNIKRMSSNGLGAKRATRFIRRKTALKILMLLLSIDTGITSNIQAQVLALRDACPLRS